ncbi:MaoC family dehydratase [Actinophytocola sp.]|uniref:MaoC family dehydratase n=1 Tax=Actinophytocola sp. TaxID=1872138 RepID=UPI003D6B56DE
MTTNHPRGRYFEDLAVGEVFVSDVHEVTADQIRDFARLMGETNPLHVDPEFARRSRFGTIIASGSFGLTLAISLIDELEVFHGTAVAALGIESWRFGMPVVAGARLRSRMRIDELRPRDHVPDTGIVVRYFELVDTDDTIVQSGLAPLLVERQR